MFGVYRNVTIESCFVRTILQRNYRKMTIKWSFSYNFFVKFHGEKNWESQHDYPNLCYNEVCYKGTALCMLDNSSFARKPVVRNLNQVIQTSLQSYIDF